MLRILCIPHEGLPSSQSVCQEEELYTINYKTINYKTSILREKGKCVCGLIQPLENSWITDFISIKQICNFKTWNQDYKSAVILDLDSRISFLKTLDCAYVHQPSCGFISVLELCLPGFSFLALWLACLNLIQYQTLKTFAKIQILQSKSKTVSHLIATNFSPQKVQKITQIWI